VFNRKVSVFKSATILILDRYVSAKQIKMKNFIKPKIVLGTIKITPVDWTDKYYIGEANLAIEKIGDVQILNIWANSYHYELHNEKGGCVKCKAELR